MFCLNLVNTESRINDGYWFQDNEMMAKKEGIYCLYLDVLNGQLWLKK